MGNESSCQCANAANREAETGHLSKEQLLEIRTKSNSKGSKESLSQHKAYSGDGEVFLQETPQGKTTHASAQALKTDALSSSLIKKVSLLNYTDTTSQSGIKRFRQEDDPSVRQRPSQFILGGSPGSLGQHDGELNPKLVQSSEGDPSSQLVELGPGDFYEGDILRGQFQGQGRLVLASKGVEYEGGWANSLRQGKGIEKWADGRIFKGEFEQDSMTYGELTFPNGNSYIGQFVDSKLNGFGVLKTVGESEYSGQFFDGLKQGKGKIKYENGNYYDGEFFKGKKHGQGLFYWASESKTYEGDWFNNKPHGVGYISEFGNAKIKALFQEGELQSYM